MKILVVDDSRVMRVLLMRALSQAGFSEESIEQAENGAVALQYINANAPDVVLSDCNMPEMTGVELLRALRQSGSNVQFGFVSSTITEEMRAEAAKAGAFFVPKPFTLKQIEETLRGVLHLGAAPA